MASRENRELRFQNERLNQQKDRNDFLESKNKDMVQEVAYLQQ